MLPQGVPLDSAPHGERGDEPHFPGASLATSIHQQRLLLEHTGESNVHDVDHITTCSFFVSSPREIGPTMTSSLLGQ
jgi:hypothetical protein